MGCPPLSTRDYKKHASHSITHIPHPPAQHADSKEISPFSMIIEKHNNLFESVGYKDKVRKVGYNPRLLPATYPASTPYART